MTYWLLGILGSIIAAFIYECLRPNKKKKTKDSEVQPTIKEEIKKLEYEMEIDLPNHKKALCLARQHVDYRPYPLGSNERWEVFLQWDVSERTIEPEIISWSPKGELLAVGCHAFGLTLWRKNGQKVYNHEIEGSVYGYPRFIFWSEDEKWVSLISETARAIYIVIHDGYGRFHSINPRPWYDFGCDFNLEFLKADQAVFVSPWRPGTNQILFVKFSGPELHLVNAYDLLNNENDIDKIPNKEILDFSNLGAKDNTIFRFCWDQSGKYLAVTAGSTKEDFHSRHIHIIEFDSRKIVASIPASNVGIRWSPDNNELICETREYQENGNVKKVISIWDPTTMKLRPARQEDTVKPWIKNLEFYSTKVLGKPNAFGNRILLKKQIIDTENKSKIYKRLPNISSGAWSPVDPTLLATVGGNDSPSLLRLWCPKFGLMGNSRGISGH